MYSHASVGLGGGGGMSGIEPLTKKLTQICYKLIECERVGCMVSNVFMSGPGLIGSMARCTEWKGYPPCPLSFLSIGSSGSYIIILQ